MGNFYIENINTETSNKYGNEKIDIITITLARKPYKEMEIRIRRVNDINTSLNFLIKKSRTFDLEVPGFSKNACHSLNIFFQLSETNNKDLSTRGYSVKYNHFKIKNMNFKYVSSTNYSLIIEVQKNLISTADKENNEMLNNIIKKILDYNNKISKRDKISLGVDLNISY